MDQMTQPALRVVKNDMQKWNRHPLENMALFLIAIGVAALVTAGSVVILPHEVAILHLDLDLLHHHHHDHTLGERCGDLWRGASHGLGGRCCFRRE